MGNPVTDVDVLILGLGLAGSTLAWRLAERGVSVAVVDRGGVDELGKPTASRIAAGLITPVTGKRLTVADDFDVRWNSAREFYRRMEKRCGESLLQVEPAVRVFSDEAERRLFLDRQSRGLLGSQARLAADNESPRGMPAPFGAMVMPGAARLRIAAYLDATQQQLESEGRYFRAAIDPERDIDVTPEGVVAKSIGVAAKRLVLCQGYTPRLPRWMEGVRFRPAQGEVLTIESASYQETWVVHRGVWLAPDGAPGRLRVGSTTEWDRLDSTPTGAARAELLARLQAAGVGGGRVVEHLAAVRPATIDRKPALGFCGVESAVGWFNGLGAKGSLWAPSYAEKMAQMTVESLG